MKILLMGNPNVGKSVVFNRLTGVDVLVSNYPGTTVDFTKGTIRVGDETHELIDVPGAYSLEPTSKAEEIACKMIEEGDLIINVLDATNLERNLYLTLELLERNKPVIVVLNMWDDTAHKGIHIDNDKLEEILDVPCVPTVAISGEGIKELVERIKEAHTHRIHEHTKSERWKDVGKIISEVQKVEHRHHTILERIEDATLKPLTGIPFALLVLFLTFQIIVTLGNFIIESILDPVFYNYYGPFIVNLVNSFAPSGIIHEILIGQLVEGELDFQQSFGLFTTGLYVPLGMVLPFVIMFYFMLSFLEDVGYLPRLAVLIDSIMHRIGLHGTAIITTILGLGCNVPGALATRVLETKKQRFIALTLMAIAVPCAAQSAMLIGLLGTVGLKYLFMVFGTLISLYLVIGFILNKVIPGESPEILLEIPPYRRPSIISLLKKTWIRIRWFLSEAVPFVLLGVLIVNILYITKMIEFLSKIFSPVLTGLLGLPPEAIAALIIGFLRKDVAVGMLLPLGMTPEQLVISAVILVIYFPCVATFAVLLRELGIRDLLKAAALMMVVSLVVGTLMRLILIGI